MNKTLSAQISQILGTSPKFDSKFKDLFTRISQLFDEYEDKIHYLETQKTTQSPIEIENINRELRQQYAYQQDMINNLKSAIAALEPNSPTLQTSTEETGEGELTYLTNSLLKLIEAEKEASKRIEEKASELESLNKLLQIEKSTLAQQQAKDQAVLLAIGDALVVTDKEESIQMVNKTFEHLLGFTFVDIKNKKFSDIAKLEDKYGHSISKSEYFHLKSIQTGEKIISPAEKTYYLVVKDGKKLPVRITSTPIILNNKIAGSVSVLRDITDEEELNKSKTEFVSIASHQLRTPLSSINWYTEILLDDKELSKNQDYRTYIEEIQNAKERMTDIINALLDVSRIELGTYKIAPEKTKSKELILRVINDLKSEISSKKLNISLTIHPSINDLLVDTKLFTIMVQNLISNSVKYTPENGRIEILLSQVKNNTLHLFFQIKDTGYGISEKDKDKIFSKMFRADNVRKISTDGNGLGLYIVKSIIESIGGNIWFESKLNKGTTFRFVVPKTWEQRNVDSSAPVLSGSR